MEVVIINIELKKVKLANGETLGYREREGGEELLLLIHGNMTSSKHWDLLMENIDERYKIYAVDLRGFGISTYNNPVDSLADFSGDFKLFVDKLNLKGFHLIGWSTGGGVAMEFTATYSDYVKKLILLESVGTRGYPIYKKDENGKPIPGKFLTTREEIDKDPMRAPAIKASRDKDKQALKMVWEQLIYTDNKPEPEKYEEYMEDVITQRNLLDIYYCLANFNISDEHNGVKQGSEKAAAIDVPTLVLWGDNDRVVPEQMALDIKNDIGDNATLRYLEGCGHSPLIDDLDQLLKKVTLFLEK